ncbi:MAG: RIP metalloprotease RseP [Candidatus Levybacteria bacterium RIFCSPLOWO2_01_FULL_36_13]|nr:MAG: RIP metalloprotease RseP [Candidatus Levybacteria bacterium RIFCSPHIGHO2_01_FULL_36_15b]OGH35386.1 MAG: RIP metalloprotease RseP [Candidatus Levybacteria bacterium RIFCSPLOWO2_01_FULL_36_13]
MIVTILVFLVILSILVLIHEAGHFFVARFFNIKVEEFGFGIPPRAFGKKIGETLYSINWLPIGGFVKLYGEDEAGAGKVSLSSSKPKPAPKDESRAFYSRPVWQRFAVVFAGVFMNFVLAVAIVSVLFSIVGVSVPAKHVLVREVLNDSPAEKAGIIAGDIIENINGDEIESPQEVISLTKKHLGEEITLRIQNQGKERIIKITPRKVYPKNQGPLGVGIEPNFETKKYPIWEAPFVGTREVLNQTGLILQGLSNTLVQIFTQGKIPSDVAGPVGIAQITGKIVSIGPSAVLSFMALLSLNLAIINVLPIPALDGGRLLFIVIEGVTRKKVSPRAESMAHTIGMAFLLGLIALITIHDIFRALSGQPILPQLK